MDLSEIIKVKTLYDEDRVNDHLSLGWILIETASESSQNPTFDNARIIFSIGWPKSNGDVKEPQEASARRSYGIEL